MDENLVSALLLLMDKVYADNINDDCEALMLDM